MNEFQIIWYLIVTVVTQNGVTQFDLEYETKKDCMIAMNNTQDIQRRKLTPRFWVMECREWPLETSEAERSTRV